MGDTSSEMEAVGSKEPAPGLAGPADSSCDPISENEIENESGAELLDDLSECNSPEQCEPPVGAAGLDDEDGCQPVNGVQEEVRGENEDAAAAATVTAADDNDGGAMERDGGTLDNVSGALDNVSATLDNVSATLDNVSDAVDNVCDAVDEVSGAEMLSSPLEMLPSVAAEGEPEVAECESAGGGGEQGEQEVANIGEGVIKGDNPEGESEVESKDEGSGEGEGESKLEIKSEEGESNGEPGKEGEGKELVPDAEIKFFGSADPPAGNDADQAESDGPPQVQGTAADPEDVKQDVPEEEASEQGVKVKDEEASEQGVKVSEEEAGPQGENEAGGEAEETATAEVPGSASSQAQVAGKKMTRSCYYCDDVDFDVFSEASYVSHLRDKHNIVKNCEELVNIIWKRQAKKLGSEKFDAVSPETFVERNKREDFKFKRSYSDIDSDDEGGDRSRRGSKRRQGRNGGAARGDDSDGPSRDGGWIVLDEARGGGEVCRKCDVAHELGLQCVYLLKNSSIHEIEERRRNMGKGSHGHHHHKQSKGSHKRKVRTLPPSVYNNPDAMVEGSRYKGGGGGGRVESPSDDRWQSHSRRSDNKRSGRTCMICSSPSHVVKYCPELTCYKCGRQGHFAKECPAPAGAGRSQQPAGAHPQPHHHHQQQQQQQHDFNPEFSTDHGGRYASSRPPVDYSVPPPPAKIYDYSAGGSAANSGQFYTDTLKSLQPLQFYMVARAQGQHSRSYADTIAAKVGKLMAQRNFSLSALVSTYRMEGERSTENVLYRELDRYSEELPNDFNLGMVIDFTMEYLRQSAKT